MLYMNLKVNGKSDGQSVGSIAFLQGRKLKKCCAINLLSTIYFNCKSYSFSLETPDLLINPEISIP